MLRADPDGGHTLVALLEDGVGGTYRHVPLSDAGIAAFSSAPAFAGVFVDPVVYQANLKEVGVFAHSFTLDGTPFLTLGTYVTTTDAGIVRAPSVMLENVQDLDAAAAFAGSLVGDDALPLLAEALPHGYGLVAPDSRELTTLAAADLALVAAAPLIAVNTVEGVEGPTPFVNFPAEVYTALDKIGADMAQLALPLVDGPRGLPGEPGDAAPYAEDWTDRPEVLVWTVRKVAGGSELWKGAYVERTGRSNGAVAEDFEGTKRVETGIALRADGVLTHVAGVYEQVDVSRQGSPGALASIVRYTVGATAADAADAPVVALEMEHARADAGDGLYLYPSSQQEDWRAGVYAGDEFVPLLGARTSVRHDVHDDITNLGRAVAETETERISSLGAYVDGAYTPLVGARYWGERNPAEIQALAFVNGGLLGDQDGGDVEVSAGAFILGAYTPAVGLRIDDDFQHHLHDHRTLVSAGTYVEGAYAPLVGTTYDGERPMLVWTVGHMGDAPAADTRWQTSAGAFTLGFYRPVFGTRYEPTTTASERAQQESYQVGVYPLNYDPFIPILALDYDGDSASIVWVFGAALGTVGNPREGDFDADVVAFTPGPYAFPLAGVQYRADAPDQAGAYDTHVVLGAYDGAAFVPLVGATVSLDTWPSSVALAQLTGGGSEARVSAGPYVEGTYVPLGTVDTAVLPATPPVL